MDHERMNGRIQRLLDARGKCMAKIAVTPALIKEFERRAALAEDAPDFADELEAQAGISGQRLRTRNMKRKVAEYDASLANFQKHGQETSPTGNRASVKIDVPKGTFKITDHAPTAG